MILETLRYFFKTSGKKVQNGPTFFLQEETDPVLSQHKVTLRHFNNRAASKVQGWSWTDFQITSGNVRGEMEPHKYIKTLFPFINRPFFFFFVLKSRHNADAIFMNVPCILQFRSQLCYSVCHNSYKTRLAWSRG